MTAGQAQQYDPTNPTPYQAPAMPEPAPASPSPLPTQGPEINGAVKKSGAVATIADGILRGFMQGRAMHQARQVMQLKKKTDDLQNSYNQDAVRLYQLTQAGYNDPSATAEQKQQYVAARSSVDGSWGALIDFYGQHIEQPQKGKKSAGKKVEGGLAAMFGSQDPMQVSQAWYQVARQAGAPVYSQIASMGTKEAQAGRQAQQLGAANAVGQQENEATKIQAQKDYDDLKGKPESQLTDPERQKLARATAILFPPRQTGTTRQYRGPNGELDWYLPGEAPEGWHAVPSSGGGAKKLYKSPDASKEEYYAPGEEPEGWQPDVKVAGGLKPGSLGYALVEKYGEHPTYAQYMEARRDAARASHVGGAGGAGASDKNYQKWYAYYKQHYPGMQPDELDSLTRRKVEGSSQIQAGGIASDAATQPKQFDSDVIAAAIDKVRSMPQWQKATNADGQPLNLDDAVANIVGLGDSGYMYHSQGQAPKNPDGTYSGHVSEDQLKSLERDLQTQIRVIMSKQTGLPPDQKRAAATRMAPLFGPAAASGGNMPASPQASRSTPVPPSSGAHAGGLPHQGPSKGIVKKSAFLKANKGATDQDWNDIKPQLQQEGYDTKDE